MWQISSPTCNCPFGNLNDRAFYVWCNNRTQCGLCYLFFGLAQILLSKYHTRAWIWTMGLLFILYHYCYVWCSFYFFFLFLVFRLPFCYYFYWFLCFLPRENGTWKILQVLYRWISLMLYPLFCSRTSFCESVSENNSCELMRIYGLGSFGLK